MAFAAGVEILIVGINYETQRIFVKYVLTHADYDKGDWKK